MLVNRSYWLREVAEILNTEFKKDGYNVKSNELPKWVGQCVAVFVKEMRTVMN